MTTLPGQRCLADASKRMELPECDADSRALAQQAWQGHVDGGEERAAGTAALVRYRVCSGVHPRGAGCWQFHALGRGCKPPPEGQQECHQHRGSRLVLRQPGAGGFYSVSVFQSVGSSGAGVGPSQATCLRFARFQQRWHRPSSAASSSVWIKLQTNQPLTALR